MKKILFSIAVILSLYTIQAQTPLESSEPINYSASGISKVDYPNPDPYVFASGINIGRVGAGVVRVHTGLESPGGYFEMPTEPIESPESVEIVKVFISSNATWAAQNASIAIYAGTSKYTGYQQAWLSPGSMTLIATKSTQGSNEIEVTGNALTAMKNWLDDRGIDKKKIYFTIKFSDEDNSSANLNGLSLRVQYLYKYKLRVTVDADYDGNIGSVSGTYTTTEQIGGSVLDFIAYKDETITLSLNQAGTIGTDKYAFNNMEVDGSGHFNIIIGQRIHSFSLTGFTTAHIDYVPGIIVTLDNQVQFLSGATGRIVNSTLRASQAGVEIATVNAGNTVIAPQDGIIDYTTLWGNYGEDLNYQSTKIKHQNWNGLAVNTNINLITQSSNDNTYTAWYHELRPATVAATLEGVTAGNVAVQMKDPWRVVSGSQPGNWDDYNTTTSNSLGIGNSGTAAGVMLNVNYDQFNPTNAHYRLKANPQTIGDYQAYVTNWSASNAQIYSSTSTETPVKFNSSGATVTANFKASFASNNTAAIANAGQKKFVRARYNNQNNNALYMVYESMGFIWMERSTDNGSSWHSMTNNQPISPSGSITPSIASVTGSGSEDYIAVTYAIPSSGGSSVSMYLRVFVVKSGGIIVTDLGTTLVNEYVAIGGYYPPLYVCNPVVSINNGNRILVAWEGHNDANPNKNTFLYWFGIIEKDISGNATGYSKLSLGRISGTSNTSSLPAMDATYGDYFHLAWRDGSNGTIYYKRMYEYSGSIVQETTYPVSNGCGYIRNTKPSIISLGNSARISWVGFQPTEEEYLAKGQIDEGDYQTLFTATDYLYNFWSFGSDVITTGIGANKTSSYSPISEYIISWASNSGSTNQYTRNSTLGGSIFTLSAGGTPISGNDLHVVPGTAFSNMFGVVLNTQQSPYRFKLSASIGTLGKQNDRQPINNGRQGIVWKENAQFYFMLGDISVDGTSIKFVEKPDTIVVDSKGSLNTYLTTEPFSVSDASKFYYSVRYHIVDSTKVAKLLDENGEITFTVQLIDDNSNTIIGEFDKVVFSKANQFPYRNIGYQIVPKGIGNKTVRLRLVADANVDMNYSLVQRHSSDAAVNLGKGNNQRMQIGYKGSFVISDYALDQNYPNPFNPTTTISYALPQDGMVTLKIYDALGREVSTLVNEFKQTGRYTASLDASRLSSGVYIYKLTSGKYSATRKMLLLK